MGIEVVLHQPNVFYLPIVFVEQVLPNVGIIHGGALRAHFDRPKAGGGLKGQEDTARTVFFIFIMVPFRFARPQG